MSDDNDNSTTYISIRMTRAQKRQLQRRAEYLGTSTTRMVRWILLGEEEDRAW